MAKGGTGTKRQRTTKVETLRHKDKRVNIPTEELRDFVAEEEKAPKPVRYPRDPSLDPQLVWKGKDEQDSGPLVVPAAPIYIQEKIHPQAIIEDLRQATKGDVEPQMQLYADFNGLPKEFEKRVDFYHYDQDWSNRMILGDSLMVMTSLAEKEGLKGKIQVIYFDPPYGISFGSNWQVSTRKRNVKDTRAEDVTRQPEQIKAFRDTWQFGIHSYLTYLRDRLTVGHQLMAQSGSIFLQIGDTNVHLVRSLLDEVFGAENFVAEIVLQKTSGQDQDYLDSTCDFIVWYAKSFKEMKYRQLFVGKTVGGKGAQLAQFRFVQLPDGTRRPLLEGEPETLKLSEGARLYRFTVPTSRGSGGDTVFDFSYEGQEYLPPQGRHWSTHKLGMERLAKADRLVSTRQSINYVKFLDDFAAYPLNNLWNDVATTSFGGRKKQYVVETNPKIVERCIQMTTDPGDLVLDPTCGSGTTAFVAEHWGRRWITIDTSRVALALARARLMSRVYPYFLLMDSTEGLQKEAELTGVATLNVRTEGDVKKGFVYERLPHRTLKSIANNKDIDQIHEKWQPELERLRAELNQSLKEKWNQWQVPLETDPGWPERAKVLHREWLGVRRNRQLEIDASIASHADPEFLYDQPYPDASRVRVSGRFTVESLSPHRIIAASEQEPHTEAEASKVSSANFAQSIVDNLRKAGVQNNVKNERLKFERLETYAGVYINAAGEYLEKGKSRRVAVSIGPEYGTVGPDLVKEAAKEAVQGLGFDLLIVCGFAFDPHVGEEVKRYGKLVILPTRMNNDLAMGDELLKKTGAGNLFMVFGEPDIDIQKLEDRKLIVKVKGVDVYDPTTGQIRNSSTDDIACWFIDTDYNGESFFVRHAYFTGADEPYDKLKKALRAEIDEAAWASLYSTESRPFPRPTARDKKPPQIAVKVINHYGDEVMKVFKV
jgi:adenine-specific DNA-methyltransferase